MDVVVVRHFSINNLTYLPIVSVNVVRSKIRLLKEISYEEKHQKISSKN